MAKSCCAAQKDGSHWSRRNIGSGSTGTIKARYGSTLSLRSSRSCSINRNSGIKNRHHT